MDKLYGTGTALDMNRVDRFFNHWYRPQYSMSTDDWLYIALLLWLSVMGFALGLFAGWIWGLII
jgi:hypothetical protein